MAVRVAVMCLALVMTVAMPAVLPTGWSDAYAKRSRGKIEKPRRTKTQKRTEPRTAPEPAIAMPQPEPARPSFVWPFTVSLSTDRSNYKPGDLMTVTAVADAACDLTLISIDAEGFAVVLFPNEYEPDNLLPADTPITIPGASAAYQLRAKYPGTETLLGICSPPGTRPHGIVADYERYRFTLLGPWADFSTTIPQREAEIVKAAADAQRKRTRRQGPLPPLAPSSDTSSQGRSVLLVSVEGP